MGDGKATGDTPAEKAALDQWRHAQGSETLGQAVGGAVTQKITQPTDKKPTAEPQKPAPQTPAAEVKAERTPKVDGNGRGDTPAEKARLDQWRHAQGSETLGQAVGGAVTQKITQPGDKKPAAEPQKPTPQKPAAEVKSERTPAADGNARGDTPAEKARLDQWRHAQGSETLGQAVGGAVTQKITQPTDKKPAVEPQKPAPQKPAAEVKAEKAPAADGNARGDTPAEKARLDQWRHAQGSETLGQAVGGAVTQKITQPTDKKPAVEPQKPVPQKPAAEVKTERAPAASEQKKEANDFGKWAGGFIRDTENDIVKAGGIKADSISAVFKTAVTAVPDNKPVQPAAPAHQQVARTAPSGPQ